MGLATTHLADALLNAFPARNLGLSGGIDAAAMLYASFPWNPRRLPKIYRIRCRRVAYLGVFIQSKMPENIWHFTFCLDKI